MGGKCNNEGCMYLTCPHYKLHDPVIVDDGHGDPALCSAGDWKCFSTKLWVMCTDHTPIPGIVWDNKVGYDGARMLVNGRPMGLYRRGNPDNGEDGERFYIESHGVNPQLSFASPEFARVFLEMNFEDWLKGVK